MKKIKFVVPFLFIFLLLTGCNNNDNDEQYEFIKACNDKPGCKYKVLSQECVCDKTHTYTPYTS